MNTSCRLPTEDSMLRRRAGHNSQWSGYMTSFVLIIAIIQYISLLTMAICRMINIDVQTLQECI